MIRKCRRNCRARLVRASIPCSSTWTELCSISASTIGSGRSSFPAGTRSHGLENRRRGQLLVPKFQAVRGTIQWYCIDYWSAELGSRHRRHQAGGAGDGSRLSARRAGISRQARGQRQAAGARDQRPSRDAGDQERAVAARRTISMPATRRMRSRPKEDARSGRGSTPGSHSSRSARCSSTTACRCSMPPMTSASRGCARCGCRIRPAAAGHRALYRGRRVADLM